MDRTRTAAGVAVLGVLAVAALGLAACTTTTPTTTTKQPATTTAPATTSAQPATTAPTARKFYAAVLRPVNRSGVGGEAMVIVSGTTLSVQIRARGMEPNKEHAQHIHGFAGGRVSTCPPAVAGTVTPEPQAETYYGPVLLPLAPFPTANASGTIAYRGTLTAASDVPTITLLPLDGRAIVLHGMMVGGTYDPSVPVACGELRSISGSSPPAGMTTTPGGTATGTGGSTEESGENPGSSAETP